MSMDEFNSLSRAFVDEMGVSLAEASEAVLHNWSPEKVGLVKKFVADWNKRLKTNVECTFKAGQGRGDAVRDDDVAGIRDGKLVFTQTFADQVLLTPDIIIGHECGHEIERMNNPQADGTTDGLKKSEFYIHPGFEMTGGIYGCPPFGATKYHDRELTEVFGYTYQVRLADGSTVTRSGLQDVGYGARQIYADGVPLKSIMYHTAHIGNTREIEEYVGKKGELNTEGILREWCTFLDSQYDALDRSLRGGGTVSFVGTIPMLARFCAVAFALKKVATCGRWVYEPASKELGDRFLIFEERFTKLLEEPREGTGLQDSDIKDFIELPSSRYAGSNPSSGKRKSGANERWIYTFAILTRAYTEHLINCLNFSELFEGEDLRPHIEKLHLADEETRRREASVLHSFRSPRTFDALFDKLREPDETKNVRVGVANALENVVLYNTYEGALNYLPRIGELLKDGEPAVKAAAVKMWGFLAREFPKDERVLNHLQDVVGCFRDPDAGVRESAFESWDRFHLADPKNPRLPKDLDEIAAHIADPNIDAGVNALIAFVGYAGEHPESQDVLNQIPQVSSLFNDPDWRVQDRALDAWRAITHSNKGNMKVLAQYPKIAKLMRNDQKYVRANALDVWGYMAQAFPGNHSILKDVSLIAQDIAFPYKEPCNTDNAWKMALTANPGNPEFAEQIPFLLESYTKTQYLAIRWQIGYALDAFERTHPSHPLIQEIKKIHKR